MECALRPALCSACSEARVTEACDLCACERRCCVPLLFIHMKRRMSDVEAQKGDGRVGDGRLTWDVNALKRRTAWT